MSTDDLVAFRKKAREAKKKGDVTIEQLYRDKSHVICYNQVQDLLKQFKDTELSLDQRKKAFNDYIKKIKETSGKDYKHEWALETLQWAQQYCKDNADFEDQMTKVDNAIIACRQDEHDWLQSHPQEKGTSSSTYVFGALLVVAAVAAVGYYRYKVKK